MRILADLLSALGVNVAGPEQVFNWTRTAINHYGFE